jgi:hypothetical protein
MENNRVKNSKTTNTLVTNEDDERKNKVSRKLTSGHLREGKEENLYILQNIQ